MKIIDLTMPYYNGQPGMYGFEGCKAAPTWPEAFKVTETMSYEPSGMRFHVYTVMCEPGTRFILASFMKAYKNEATLDTVPLTDIILRDAVILDIPKGDDEIIQAGELEAAFKKAPVKKGDALIIRTGWGDNQRYFKMGRLFQDNSPHFNAASADKLVELLEKNGSNLWTYDVESMSGLDKKTGIRGGFSMHSGMMAVGSVVNCGAITKPRVKLIAAPLKAKGGHMGPCSAVVIED
ncbi:MAG: cyclase family protein [Chloroflexi bacterium]|nr:cyclase family protein [Chloroflexota bacterium]